jgi:hypothetical protein
VVELAPVEGLRAATMSDNFGRTLRIDLQNAGQRSAQRRLDNCFTDQAVTNGARLAELLSGADASVVSPSG